MSIFQKKHHKYLPYVLAVVYIIFFTMIAMIRVYDIDRIMWSIIYFFSFLIPQFFINHDERLIYNLETSNEHYFKLYSKKGLLSKSKVFEVPYKVFKLTNLKIYRGEIQLFTKEDMIRLKPNISNYDNILVLFEKINEKEFLLDFEENIKGIILK